MLCRTKWQEMALMDYVVIDFEASCLPSHGRSFPIEVGIADAAGTRSWLIKPHLTWRDWDWTEEAFGLHGITNDQLNAEGVEPETVFDELRQAIAGRCVVADSMIDAYWWDTLAAVTSSRDASPIRHASLLLDEWSATSDIIFAACREADRLCPERHRAADDARWLWTVLSTARARLEMPLVKPWRQTRTKGRKRAASQFRPAVSASQNPVFMS